MSEKLTVFHGGRTAHVSKPASALVQSVLEDACRSLGADAAAHKLVLEKGNKAIDHTLTLRQANLKAANDFTLAPLGANKSALVSVTVAWKDASYTESVPVGSSLWSALEAVERKAGVQWTPWHGVPEPEINAQFEVHINVAGYMQPVVEVGGGRKLASTAELQATTLANLGLQSDAPTPSKMKLKLSHTYTAPQRSEQEQKEVMDMFHKKYHEMLQAATSSGRAAAAAPAASAAAAASSVAAPRAAIRASTSASHTRAVIDDDEDVDVDDSDDDEKAPAIPPDRALRLFHALPGLVPPPELPDEFYEVTEEDSRTYARSIQREANRARAAAMAAGRSVAAAVGPTIEEITGNEPAAAVLPDLQGPLNPAFAPRAAATAASSRSPEPLLDSARLPPVRRSKRRRPRLALLRVRLPDHLYVEGVFRSEETPRDLYSWLDGLLDPACTADAASRYYLYVTPPRQQLSRTSKLTFAQLGLLPAAIVHYGTDARREQGHAPGALETEAAAKRADDSPQPPADVRPRCGAAARGARGPRHQAAATRTATARRRITWTRSSVKRSRRARRSLHAERLNGVARPGLNAACTQRMRSCRPPMH